MSEDPHTGFIVAAYAVAFIVIVGMVLAILFDQVALKRALSKVARHRGESLE